MFKGMSFSQFENLTFDLVNCLGLQNVTWRTPGADGGRDIEGIQAFVDFAGITVQKKWFIECKHYSNAVDWPTIYKKLSFAHSNGADYLLMCTSASYSTTATDETKRWNAQNNSPQIRLWPGSELEHQLAAFPDLMAKYGLSNVPAKPGPSIATLSLALSNTIAVHFGSAIFSDQEIDPFLEASQKIALLLQQRISDLDAFAAIRPILKAPSTEVFHRLEGENFEMDVFAFDAIVSYVHAITKRDIIVVGTTEHSCKLNLAIEDIAIIQNQSKVIKAICIWGDLEFDILPDSIHIKQRVT